MKQQPSKQVDSMTQAIDLLSKIHAELQIMNESHGKEESKEKDSSKSESSTTAKPGPVMKKIAKKCAECFNEPCTCKD